MRSDASTILGVLLVVMTGSIVVPVVAEPPPQAPADSATAARAGDICLACRNPVTATDRLIQHRGRRVHLHRGECSDHWAVTGETIFAALEPHSALFEEHAILGGQMASGWFLFGIYMVIGLGCGAACAYLAVSRGWPAFPWFVAGLIGSVIALVVAWKRPAADLSELPGGMPPGLAKVPATRLPAVCAACGAGVHPAARRCTSCGAVLTPRFESETARVRGEVG